jgi:hypothetical protein
MWVPEISTGQITREADDMSTDELLHVSKSSLPTRSELPTV